MIGQILGNSAGTIKVAATNEGIRYNFGLHNGQYSNAARIAPRVKYRVLSDACAPILYSILRTSGGAVRQISSSISNRLRPLSMRSLRNATR